MALKKTVRPAVKKPTAAAVKPAAKKAARPLASKKPAGAASAEAAAAKAASVKATAAKAVPAPVEAAEEHKERYWEAVGRRKTAVARVRIFSRGEKGMRVNGQPASDYFRYPLLRQIAAEALETMKTSDRFRATAKVSGGGLHAQAEAIRHGTARALILFNSDFRKRLKKAGFLTRDPRMKERKKFGLKGARKAPQWAKR